VSNARAARRRSDRNSQGPLPDIGLFFNGAFFEGGHQIKQHMDRILDLMSGFPVLKQGDLTIREHLVLEDSSILNAVFPKGEPISVEFSVRVTQQQQHCVLVVVNEYVERFRKALLKVLEELEEMDKGERRE